MFGDGVFYALRLHHSSDGVFIVDSFMTLSVTEHDDNRLPNHTANVGVCHGSSPPGLYPSIRVRTAPPVSVRVRVRVSVSFSFSVTLLRIYIYTVLHGRKRPGGELP